VPRVVSLLRGINVGGARPIKMPALRDLYEELGFTNVETYVQSGNVVFDTSAKNLRAAAKKIEKGIAETFHHDDVDVIVLDAAAMKRVVEGNPYTDRTDDAKQLHVFFLAGAPDPAAYERLRNDDSKEAFSIGDEPVVYLYLPDGLGRSKLAAAMGRTKGPAATARNWRTTLKLLDMVGG
jgi:uncharacterized protein (DUF1697 family)